MTPLEAFDHITDAELLESRLAAARAELVTREGAEEEKRWLSDAHRRLVESRSRIGHLLTRVLRLPELEPVKRERARSLQSAAVDSVEGLHAAISAAGGERAPLLDLLYRDLKLPLLRKADRVSFGKFCKEIEKRLASSYMKRMLADPQYDAAAPALGVVREAFSDWQGAFAADPPEEAEAAALRDELQAFARGLDVPCRQARLLVDAALMQYADILASAGLLDKPRPRRTIRAPRTQTASELEVDPGDSAPAPVAILIEDEDE